MMRTCLGTEKAWEEIAGYVPLNPVFLRAVIKRMTDENRSLAEIDAIARDEIKRLRALTVLGWHKKSFKLFGEVIELPMLSLDYNAISAVRKSLLT